MTTSNRCPLSHSELYDLVAEAQDHLLQAVSALRNYVAFSGDTHTERTLLAGIEILASAEHGWLSRDRNLDDLLHELAARSGEESDEDDETEHPNEESWAMLWESTNR